MLLSINKLIKKLYEPSLLNTLFECVIICGCINLVAANDVLTHTLHYLIVFGCMLVDLVYACVCPQAKLHALQCAVHSLLMTNHHVMY